MQKDKCHGRVRFCYSLIGFTISEWYVISASFGICSKSFVDVFMHV